MVGQWIIRKITIQLQLNKEGEVQTTKTSLLKKHKTDETTSRSSTQLEIDTTITIVTKTPNKIFTTSTRIAKACPSQLTQNLRSLTSRISPPCSSNSLMSLK